MSDIECARMLLRAAERDLLALRSMSAAAPEEAFGFHVQQAAEKALKAWLAAFGETFPLTHNLATLLTLLSALGAAVARYETLADYTPYAVEFRYAGVEPEAEAIDRSGAMALVHGLLSDVDRALEKAAGESR